jgi:hypothetical protein
MFTVTEISRSTEQPETKIKLLNISKFAYGIWSGEVNSLTALSYFCDNSRNLDAITDGIKIKRYTLAPGNTIDEGDVVIVQDDGYIIKSQSNSAYRDCTKGIALESADGDDENNNYPAVQLSGVVYIESWDFTDYIDRQVFVRTNETGTNLSTELLFESTDTEDLIILVGKVDSPQSIALDFQEYKLEDSLCQA